MDIVSTTSAMVSMVSTNEYIVFLTVGDVLFM